MAVTGSNSISTYSNALKKLYRPEVVESKTYEKNPTFQRIRKIGDFEGSSYEVSISVSYGQGVGPTVAYAVANRSEDTLERFSVPRKLVYGVGSIDGELIRATKTSKGSQAVSALMRARDGNLKAVRRYLQHSLWNNGGGALGKIAAAGISGAVITLDDPNTIVWFERKMILQLASTDGTSGAVEAGTITISSVDRDNGKFTCTANVVAGIATAAAGMWIFRNGSFGAVFDGIPKYIPKTNAEAIVALYGVTRANDVTRLAGLRHETAQGATILESLLLAMARCAREGIEPDFCPMHPDDVMALVMAGQQQVMYSRTGSAAGKLEVGFGGESIRVVSPTGLAVEVVPDAGVTKGDGWLLTLSSWEYHYAGSALPELLDDDGIAMLRDADNDTYTWRVGGYGNLACVAPQENMYFKLPASALGSGNDEATP